jgi:hypothetical protein
MNAMVPTIAIVLELITINALFSGPQPRFTLLPRSRFLTASLRGQGFLVIFFAGGIRFPSGTIR